MKAISSLLIIAPYVLGGAAVAQHAPAGPDFQQRATSVNPSTPALERGVAASSSDGALQPMDVIPFRFDSSRLEPADEVLLREAASWWKANPRFRLVIEGYADAHGTDAYNIGIAARRALAVRAHLVKLGVPRDRIVTAIYGEAKPRATNPYAAANRVVVVYATTLSPNELVGRDASPRLPIVWS